MDGFVHLCVIQVKCTQWWFFGYGRGGLWMEIAGLDWCRLGRVVYLCVKVWCRVLTKIFLLVSVSFCIRIGMFFFSKCSVRWMVLSICALSRLSVRSGGFFVVE